MKDVIVLGAGYSLTLGVVRSLGMAGYNSRVMVVSNADERIVGSSKYAIKCCNYLKIIGKNDIYNRILRKVFKKSSIKIDYNHLWIALEELRGSDERILVIPVSDSYCVMLDEHAKQLSEHYVLPDIHEGSRRIVRFMDKMIQKQLARKCGLLTANGNVFSTDERGIRGAIQQNIFPCFVKVLISANVSHGKTFYSICKNELELEQAMKKAGNGGCNKVLVEEFLETEKELCAYGVAYKGSVLIPACMETLRGGIGACKGVAVEGVVTSAKRLGKTKEKLKQFVKESGLTGLFCIDMIQSKGEHYFLEMNLRSGGSIYAVTLAGANLPGALADMIYHNSSSEPVEVRRTVHFLSEVTELYTYMDGFISKKEYKTHMAGGQERFIQSEVDPEPWKEFRKQVFLTRFIKSFQRLIKVK